MLIITVSGNSCIKVHKLVRVSVTVLCDMGVADPVLLAPVVRPEAAPPGQQCPDHLLPPGELLAAGVQGAGAPRVPGGPPRARQG